tara:strand:+ start:1642 stop:2541 length:900 start_codon:yes stop_codon:yes gene_type:complete
MNQKPHKNIRIIQALAYFDIFKHPLRKEELANLAGISNSEAETILVELTAQKVCYSFDQHFSIFHRTDELVNLRVQKERKASNYFKKLPFYARLISSFPFVRSIAISGSLSKGVMHDDGDIDYFIITAPNRMWICRTFLILFKKVFLLNSKKYFCINYLVDENHLEIIDKNIFTAIEVSHLLPVYNEPLINQLKKENNWTEEYLPRFKHLNKVKQVEESKPVKKILEKLLSGNLGERLDLFFMKTTYKRWGQKFRHFDPTKLQLTMRSDRGVSKHHPQDFQNKVLTAYQERINKLTANS